MKTMFEPATLGNLSIKNRLIRSATIETAGAKNGKIEPLLGQIYDDLALGGIGLIITGMMGVALNSCIHAGMTKIYDDSFSERFKRIVEDVHKKGSKIVVQLGHCGAKAKELDGTGYAFSPSDVDIPLFKGKAMTETQIHDLVKAYGVAAQRCKECGADGVQIHAAHGYLINEFLSPLFNHRTDQYGGPIEGRSKLLLDVYDEIRTQVGNSYPVLVKINYNDVAEGGIIEPDVLWYCKRLDKRGIDAIEVSAGIGLDASSTSAQGGRKDEAYNAQYALRLTSNVNTAVISVGGYRSPTKIIDVLNSGDIEAISLCRALIREPDLPNRWERGTSVKAACLTCGKCFLTPQHGCFIDYQKKQNQA